ncbi:MAG: LptF/LptG family permease [Bacteroidales bacterium]|nr:LptF/LptG family permease [Bacteroidales bacterium]
MLKKLDVYIIKKFLGTFFFTIVLILGIAIVFDISEKIDDFIEKEAPFRAIVFDYYFNFVPYYGNLFSFLFVFISVIFFTSKMAVHSEFIAMLGSGMSYRRIMRPYMISAAVIAVFSWFLSNWVIPHSNSVRLDFENTYINNTFRFQGRNYHKQISPGVYVFIESYNNKLDMGSKFSMEKFENGKLVSKLVSDYIKWDTTSNKWRIHNYRIRYFLEDGESIERGKKIDTTLNMERADFHRRATDVETMNHTELNYFIEKERLSGSGNTNAYLIEKYKRTAFPFSTFILTMMGVSLASRKVRGGTALYLGIGLGLSFSYILFMQISFQFSIGSNLSPLIAVWIPNVLYGIIALFLFRLAPK